jgi:hypothetical protein
MANVERIISRQKKLEDKKVRWNQLYSDIGRHMIPIREDALQTRESGTREGDEIYDSIGSFALNTLIRGLYGKMVNPASTWFRLRFRTEDLNELPEVKQWMQETQRHLYNVFQDSNFYDSIETFLRDFAGLGTAIMYIEEDTGEGKLNYMPINLNQCYIEQDFHGTVNILHRKIKRMQAHQVLSFFGKDTPQMVIDTIEDGHPFQEFEIVHSVSPRELRDPTKIDNKNMPFESTWIITGVSGNRDGDSNRSGSVPRSGKFKVPAEIRESGFEDFPYIVGRWETDGIEEYGRCPGMYALADVMGINLIGKTMLELAELVVNPPMNVIDGTEDNVNFMPRGINVINGPDDAPHPTDIGSAGYPLGIDQQERKEEAIKKHFFTDTILFLASQPEGSDITATEVQAREQENAIILGPIIGKMSQVFDQVINTTFRKEFEAGRIPEPPAVTQQTEGERIDIIYSGPLAQAQRTFFETAPITQGVQIIADMASLDPQVLKVVNLPEATRIRLDAIGFPQEALNTREEVDEQLAQEKLLEQQAIQLQAGQAQATTLKDLAKADKDSGGQISESLEEQGA